ncbi:ribbon-helix-helix domain-containing protein [Ralstonia solanacearum]|uniref:ribbon-helix-helix domain-containing protein n=1 Tax=Ralstonia solanacearum TaxID=305 RepID=UPI00202A3361|nr:ribbon-helix-helix domain-containing protein [Ralstonia solanacearum]MCL9846991.1 ribbon-helix-helix domain-containing protein [Ralstonia solanacearum]MDC6254953.1 ribbon-helix-helix domain-containing protein [Ralstonia solanacearum]MDC6261215.1 ribbon-helix-helix domain-containing protein [Ralstonia solanacearum]MDC6304291.1 ribbon-helix-helix domain-containing protein [Ralstonia solanacearum]
MFTFRPTPELEAQLDHLAQSTGHTKNAIANQALVEYLKTQNLRGMPLAEPVQESDFDRYVRRTEEQQKLYARAHELAESIRLNEIWTKKPDTSADLSPGINGRNIVMGFTDSMRGPDGQLDGKLYVISRNLASIGLGTDAFHLYVTEFSDWVTYMKKVDTRD